MSQPQTLSTLNRLWCGVMVVTCVGCQTYSPYGYGGYSGSYPMYNQPGQVMPYGAQGMQPGTTVVPGPQGGYPPGYPSGAMAPNSYPSGNYNPYPQGADTSGDSLGTPGQFPGAGTASPPRPNLPSDRPNLPPDDDNYLNGPSAGSATGTKRPAPTSIHPGGSSNFRSDQGGPESSTQRLKNQDTSIPAVPDAAMIRNEVTGGQYASLADGTGSLAGQSGIIQTSQHVEASHGGRDLRPYGRAPNGRAWFRGLVDFDEQENAWYLIYNPEPDASDTQGGTITLVEHPNLKLFKPDDVILVEGQFDPSVTDRYGNAKYRASVIRRLVP